METTIDKNIPMDDDDLKRTSLNGRAFERSDVAQEIISRKPDFWESWALLIFLIVFLAMLAGAWFIKYPDTIDARAVLTGENAPKELVARESGKIIGLFAVNNQRVKENDILAWLESTADTKEVIDLSDRIGNAINSIDDGQIEAVSSHFKKRLTHLGELQTSYQNFIAEWQKFDDYLVNGFYKRKRDMLYKDILALKDIENQTTIQKRFTEKDSEIARKTFEMNESLFKEKIISAEEYRQAQSKLLSSEKSVPQSAVNIATQQNQIRDKQKEIDQLDHDILQQRTSFEQALHTLKSNVDDWKRRYTIQAPTDGLVAFALPLQKNQYITQGKVLGYINPEKSNYFAEIWMGQQNFGKIDTGMKVQLRFDAYPYQEVGFVPGRLSYISEVAVDSGFMGVVRLEKGLVTNHNKHIQYKNGLTGQALVITKDMRMLERLYYSIVKSTTINN